jgi:hypothetical protein
VQITIAARARARTTRKTATPSRAERCGQVRVRVSVNSKQVTLLEHASPPLVCNSVSCAAGAAGRTRMKRERLIANSTRPCTVRRTAARPRPRGAPRRARRPGPGGGDARTLYARGWRGTSQRGSGTSAGSAYGGRPPVPLPAARTSAACRALSWRFHRRLQEPPAGSACGPGASK